MNTIMKRQLLLLVMFLLPMVANADAVEIDGIYYNLNIENKTAEVTSNPDKYENDVYIPENIFYENETYFVTGIGDESFNRCYFLNSVTLPRSIIRIGKYAFNLCRSLTSISIPDNVEIIDEAAFYDCGINTIVIPKSIKQIGSWAFNGTKISNVYIDDIDSW